VLTVAGGQRREEREISKYKQVFNPVLPRMQQAGDPLYEKN
jgi:hypothetical protein